MTRELSLVEVNQAMAFEDIGYGHDVPDVSLLVSSLKELAYNLRINRAVL